MKRLCFWFAIGAIALLTQQQANAQLLFSNGAGTEGPGSNALFFLDLDTNTSSVFADLSGFTTTGVTGIAVDNANQTVFWTNGSNSLFATDFAGATSNLGPITGAPGAPFNLNAGLAYVPGTGLVAGNNNELFNIDTTTVTATSLGVVSGSASLGGLAFDIDGNRLLGQNDAGVQSNLVAISLPAAPNVPIASILFGGNAAPGASNPADIDGLAVGNGTAFLIEDTGSLTQVDLVTGASTTTPLDFTALTGGNNGSFSAGGFIEPSSVPEPGSIVVLMLGACGALARRRRR